MDARQPLLILVGAQSNGITYALDAPSQERLHRVPDARRARKVFIACDDPTLEGAALAREAVLLLTGLTPERLEALGGVELYDPRSQTTTPLPLATAA